MAIRVAIDLNRCQAYAQCCFLAPDVFVLRGSEVVLYDPAPDDARSLQVRRAAAACPVAAINVEDPADGTPLPGERP